MNDFIGKPFDSADLIVTLRRWIKLDRKRLAPQEGAAVDAMSLAATEQALLALPGFDFDNILKTLRGNHLQVTGLLITFANSMTGISGQIKEKIGRGAFEEAHMLVHRIKGTAGSLGAIDLFQAAEHLDTQLKKDECEPETLKVFEEALERAMSAIASLGASKAAMKENL